MAPRDRPSRAGFVTELKGANLIGYRQNNMQSHRSENLLSATRRLPVYPPYSGLWLEIPQLVEVSGWLLCKFLRPLNFAVDSSQYNYLHQLDASNGNLAVARRGCRL